MSTIADGGCPGTGLVMRHDRYKQVRACVEHLLARMKTWKIPRDCRFKGDGVPHA